MEGLAHERMKAQIEIVHSRHHKYKTTKAWFYHFSSTWRKKKGEWNYIYSETWKEKKTDLETLTSATGNNAAIKMGHAAFVWWVIGKKSWKSWTTCFPFTAWQDLKNTVYLNQCLKAESKYYYFKKEIRWSIQMSRIENLVITFRWVEYLTEFSGCFTLKWRRLNSRGTRCTVQTADGQKEDKPRVICDKQTHLTKLFHIKYGEFLIQMKICVQKHKLFKLYFYCYLLCFY